MPTTTTAAICGTFAFATLLPACTQVVKNTNDQSNPDVVFKVKGADGQYAPATQTTFHFNGGDPLDFMCIVTDTGGVSQAAINYSTTVDGCTTGSEVSSGVTIDLTGIPDPISQSLTGNGSGQVLTELPLLAQLKGPLGCYGYSGGIKFTGVPQGDTLSITCTGQNWASDPAKKTTTATLAVNLQE